MNRKHLLLLFSLASFGMIAKASTPLGLINTGNSCFINASVQALYAMDDLVDLVMNEANNYRANSISNLYISFLVHARHSDQKNFNLGELSRRGWQMLNAPAGTQQTADEFLTGLLNHLADTDLTDQARATLQPYRGTNVPQNRISNLFYTLTGVHYQDGNGRRTEPRIAAHSSLMLPVREGDYSLYNCIRAFFENGDQDIFNANGQWTIAERRHSLLETQPYLIITLKRNQVVLDPDTRRPAIDNSGNIRTQKRPEAIRFPVRGLNLQNFYHDQSKRRDTYDLIAVIMHSGQDNAGHYVSYVKKNDQWYLCNDERIQEVSQETMEAISQRGYGESKTMTPTLFIYEQTILAEHRALRARDQKEKDAATRRAIAPERPSNPVASRPARTQLSLKPTPALDEPIIPDELLPEVLQGLAPAKNFPKTARSQRSHDGSFAIPAEVMPAQRNTQPRIPAAPAAAPAQFSGSAARAGVRRVNKGRTHPTNRSVQARRSNRSQVRKTAKKALSITTRRRALGMNRRTGRSALVQRKATALVARKAARRKVQARRR